MTPIVDGKVECPQSKTMPLLAYDRMACLPEKRATKAGMYKCMANMNKCKYT